MTHARDILNLNLVGLRDTHHKKACSRKNLMWKFNSAKEGLSRAQELVDKLKMQLNEEDKEVKRHEDIIKEEENCRRKLNKLLRENNNLHLEEHLDYSVVVYLGDWEEDYCYEDHFTWREAYDHAKWLLGK